MIEYMGLQRFPLKYRNVFVAAAVFACGVLVFALPAHAATVYLSGTITSSSAWTSNNVYVVTSSVTIASGTTITVNSGTIVKFVQDKHIYVDNHGVLNVLGDPNNEAYFTALDDNSVGGNTNGNSTTTPAKGDGGYIEVFTGASTTINNAFVRYGGSDVTALSNIYQFGGKLSLNNVTVASSSNYGFNLVGGTATISSSTFANNVYGIYENQQPGVLTLTNNTFFNNSSADGDIQWTTGTAMTASGDVDNVTSTGGYRGFIMGGTISTTTTWSKDLPYVMTTGITVGLLSLIHI